jgi:protein ImuA
MPRTTSLAALRDRIRQVEQPARHGVLPFGVAAIDAALPGGGLQLGAVHELLGAGGDEEDGAAAAGFAAGILARLRPGSFAQHDCHSGVRPQAANPDSINIAAPDYGVRVRRCATPRNDHAFGEADERAPGAGAILWCLARPDLYGPGLQAHGTDPARLVLVAARRDEDILWAVEEGLRAPGLAAVVGEIGRLPMVAGRRLQLAAERSGVTLLLLRRWRNAAEAAAERARPSAAATRWRVAALPSSDIAGEPGVGRPRWRVELVRCRGGVPAQWDVEVADATGHVSLSAGLADRPAAPQPRAERVAERVALGPHRRAG